MECMHACEQFAAKLDEARTVSLSMGLQDQVEAMKLLFTFLEQLQKDIMQRLSEKNYDIICHKITVSNVTIKDEFSGIEPDIDTSDATQPLCWDDSNTDLSANHFPELQFHNTNDIPMATDKVSVMRGLRNKILSGGSTTPRRQTARKSGPRCKLDNLSKFLQQRASLTQVVGLSSGSPAAATGFSPSPLSKQLVFNNAASSSACDSREVSPLSSKATPYVSDVSVSVTQTRKRHQRRDKVNGRYFCSFPQCHESYLNLEHIVDHENQHSVPDGKYLVCSFVGCKNRFKWRHYLRRHERTHHKLSEPASQPADNMLTSSSTYSTAPSSGSQLDAQVAPPFQLPFIPTTDPPVSQEIPLADSNGAAQ